jgi:hypothetical protein
MPSSFLDFPTSSDEVDDQAFDPDVAAALVCAYSWLDRSDPAAARGALNAFSRREMSRRQRVRVRYVQGLAAIRLGEYAASMPPLDEATECALDLEDVGAITALAATQGLSHYLLHEFKSAAYYYQAALDAWRSLTVTSVVAAPDDVRFEIETLTRLSSQYILLGHPRKAHKLLRTARSLTSLLPDGGRLVGPIEWNLALVHRWRGDPEQAMRHGLAALDVYAAQGTASERARLHIVLTDIALDLSNVYADDVVSDAHDRVLTLAEPFLIRAQAESQFAGDPSARAMATLAYVRYLRSSRNMGADRLAVIASVIREAEDLDDLTLLGQAITAQGDELAAQEALESSQRAYHSASSLLTRIGAPGLGYWARRALLRGEEGIWHTQDNLSEYE